MSNKITTTVSIVSFMYNKLFDAFCFIIMIKVNISITTNIE